MTSYTDSIQEYSILPENLLQDTKLLRSNQLGHIYEKLIS